MLIGESYLPNQGFYHTSVHEFEKIKKQVQKLHKKEVIVPSSSPCGSPMLLVSNKEGGWFMKADYKNLNKIVTKKCYTLPKIDGLVGQLESVRSFYYNGYQIWLSKSYNQ